MNASTPFNYIISLSLLIVLATSCSKTKVTSPVPSGPKYRITHLIDIVKYLPVGYDSETVVYNYQFTYTNNRITTMGVNQAVIYMGDTTFSSYMKTFVFYDSSYAIHYSSGLTTSDSVIFNSAHLITSVQGFNGAFFLYNKNLQLTDFSQSSGIFFSSSRCIWDSDGNIATILSTSDTSTLTYYTDKPNTLGDFFGMSNFTLYGNPIFHSKNLTKSVVNRFNTINATYAFDQNNNISKTVSVQTSYDMDKTINEVMSHSYYFTYENY